MSNKLKEQLLTPEELCMLYPEQMEELQKADVALYGKLMQNPVRKEVFEDFLMTVRLPFPKETSQCLELLLQHPDTFDEEWFLLLYEMGMETGAAGFLDAFLLYVEQEIYPEERKELEITDILEAFRDSGHDVVLFQKLLEECRIRKSREVWDRSGEGALEENTAGVEGGITSDGNRKEAESRLLEELDQLILEITGLHSTAYAEALEYQRCREEKEKLKTNYRKLQEAYKETYARCNRLQEFLKEQTGFHGELMEEDV